jgi:hypothetical protein
MTITSPTLTWTAEPRTALRTRNDDLHAVPAALRSEWIKLRSLRGNKAILALTIAISAFTAWAVGVTETEVLTAAEISVYPTVLVAMLSAIASILLFTAEAQHGTLAVTLTARPARWVLVASKTTVAATIGLALGAIGMVAGFGGGILAGLEVGDGSNLVTRALWALVYTSLAGLIGLGIGMIARHSAGAVSGLLMWSFVVENLLAPALPGKLVHFLPFSAGYRLLDVGSDFDTPVIIATQLTRPQYALIFGGYALLTLVIGTVLLHRRDTN